MRNLLRQVSSKLQSFVEQRNDVAMVLGAAETDALPLLSILEGIEAERGSDFFWTFTNPFVSAAPYAEAVIQAFAVTHKAARLAMEKEGMRPWPPLPALVESASTPPAQRLRELAAFSRQLLPVPNGGVVVWTFFPLQIGDGPAYARLMGELIAHEFPFPWCHHLRFIFRDDPGDPVVARSLERIPRVQGYAPDLSLEALNRSLEEDVADDKLPLAERMAVLPLSASNDVAFERFPEALEKYALLLQYHGSMNNFAMGAMALHGMGLVYERTGDPFKANEAYQAALVPASQGEHPPIPVFLNVVLSLANLRMTEQRWDEAEDYWDAAQQLATVARDGPLKVRALDHRGVCQERQGKTEEAEQSWRAGSIIAAQLQDADLCGALLERLRGLYAMQGNSAKASELREQLAALGREGTN
jgi:tetratricopeptide (TPR) repeat protein